MHFKYFFFLGGGGEGAGFLNNKIQSKYKYFCADNHLTTLYLEMRKTPSEGQPQKISTTSNKIQIYFSFTLPFIHGTVAYCATYSSFQPFQKFYIFIQNFYSEFFFRRIILNFDEFLVAIYILLYSLAMKDLLKDGIVIFFF